MKPGNRFLLLIGVCVVFLGLTIGYRETRERAVIEEVPDKVSGIVIHRDGGAAWIRLTSPDLMNNASTGTIIRYNMTDKHADHPDPGDYIEGTLLSGDTLQVDEYIAFFEHDFNRGFVNKGDLLLFSGGKISKDPSVLYPTLKFGLRNLGENDIVGVRASINGVQLPFTFGVTRDDPLKPSQNLGVHRYTAWFDPDTGSIQGYIPEEGDEYFVDILVKYENYKTKSFNRTEIFIDDAMGSISFMVGRDVVYFQGGELLSQRGGNGGTVYITFRNTWYDETALTIDRLELYIDDVQVMDEDVDIEVGSYSSICARISFELELGREYEVTLVAHSATGNVSEYSKSVTCEYYRLR